MLNCKIKLRLIFPLSKFIICLGPLTALTPMRKNQEYQIYWKLLNIVPGLEEWIMTSSTNEDLLHIADLICVTSCYLWEYIVMFDSQIQKGSFSAHADDTKSMKGPMLDWIALKNSYLDPCITQNNKLERGFHYSVMGFLLCPIEYNWSNEEYFYWPMCFNIYGLTSTFLKGPAPIMHHWAPC